MSRRETTMPRCFFVPEGKLNEITHKLRASSKNEDEGIIQWLASQGAEGKNIAIFYAQDRRAAKLTAWKIARECKAANPLGGLTWLIDGKTTLSALNGKIPDLRTMEPTIRFVVFVGTKEFLTQIAEEHGKSPMHMNEGDFVLELDTKTGIAREIRIPPVNDDARENGNGDKKTNGAP